MLLGYSLEFPWLVQRKIPTAELVSTGNMTFIIGILMQS